MHTNTHSPNPDSHRNNKIQSARYSDLEKHCAESGRLLVTGHRVILRLRLCEPREATQTPLHHAFLIVVAKATDLIDWIATSRSSSR